MSTKIDIKWTIAGILAVVMVFALVLVGSNQQAQAEQSDSLVIPGWLLERIVHIAEVKLGIEEPILGSTRFPNGISADSTAASAGQVRGTSLTITTGDGAFDTDTLFVDASADRVGISSSTPSSDLSVGTGGSTSTIMGGNLCWGFQDEAGTMTWITINVGGSDDNVFSSSTTACNS